MASKKIAVVIGSTRTPRVGPSIAENVFKYLAPLAPAGVSLELLDLANFDLPLSPMEPLLPAHHPNPPESYQYEHTRVWSRAILGYAGYIFVTPQYNWSIPAQFKQGIDMIFKEWTGKPTGVVSYGGQGGDKAAEALINILKGIRTKPVEKPVLLPLGPHTPAAATKGTLVEGVWEGWIKAGKGKELETLLGGVVEGLEAAPKTE